MGRTRDRTPAANRRRALHRRRTREAEREAAIARVDEDLALAREAALAARAFRDQIRRKVPPGEPRNERIDGQLEQIRAAMRPIRSHQGRVPFGLYTADQERRLAKASKALWYEAHALRRMKR